MAEHTIRAIIFALILCIDPINKEFDLVLHDFFHDREKWWILILQTYIYVTWWFLPPMSGYFAVIPVSNTSWVEKESV